VIITTAVSDEEAKTRFPQGWKTLNRTCGLPSSLSRADGCISAASDARRRKI